MQASGPDSPGRDRAAPLGRAARAGREVVAFVREVAREWSEDRCLRVGAALAYYTLFSLAPLLVIAIAIAALFFGQELAEGTLIRQIEAAVSRDAAETVREMIQRASEPRAGILATVAGLVMTAIGASSVFGQLQSALNDIWAVRLQKRAGLRALLLDRISSFLMLALIGVLMLASLGVTTAISALQGWLGDLFPGAGALIRGLDLLGSLALMTLLFGMIFKVLPDADIRWGDVWVGAAVTSLLFAIGRIAIGLYLARSSAASVYGAASSLVVMLLWIYYSWQLLLLGAEFTQVYARRYGSFAVAPADGPG
jgi:membrane protein